MFLSFRPSWCARSTFLLQICVVSTATPCCHKSVATSLTSLQGSKFPVLPHPTSPLGSMRSVKLKMSRSAVSRSWSVHLCPRWASPHPCSIMVHSCAASGHCHTRCVVPVVVAFVHLMAVHLN
ncbi:hypothetical protein PF008_g33215, partial [Phytophthora fragariae]